MLTTVHLLSGAAIGQTTGNIWLTAPAAIAVHYLLDAIPHYSPQPVNGYLEKGLRDIPARKELLFKGLEPLAGILLTTHFISASPENLTWPMLVGAFFGWLPDFIVYLYWKYDTPLLRRAQKIEKSFHRHTTFKKGVPLQIAIVFLLTLYLW